MHSHTGTGIYTHTRKKKAKQKPKLKTALGFVFADASLQPFESRICCTLSTVYALSPYEVLMKMDLIDWGLCPAAMLIVATLWCCMVHLEFVCLMLTEMRASVCM